MDNKLSELSKPVAWTTQEELIDAGAGAAFVWKSARGLNDELSLYSQEYVSALDKVAQFWIGESAGWKKRAEDAEKRIAELEAKLATPVRLLGEMLVHDWEHRVDRQAAFEHRKIAWDARMAEDKKAILAAGFTFTVEGDK